ncbi:MAG: LysM peptidoglycan-binding domain-containing protein [Cypionkella sp.]
MAAWKDMDNGSRAIVVAIVVILFGTGAYEVFNGKTPDKVAPSGSEATAVAPADGVQTGTPATGPQAGTQADTQSGTSNTGPAPALGADGSAAATSASTAPVAEPAPGADGAAPGQLSTDAAAPPAASGTALAPDAPAPDTGAADTAATGTAMNGASSATVGTSLTMQTMGTGTTSADTTAPASDAGSAQSAAAPEVTGAAGALASAPENVPLSAAPPAAGGPSFDVVRVAPDGSTVVAGQVAPGAKVSIRVDGVEVGTATADGSGKFVALFTLPAAGAGRLMTMIATMADGSRVQAGDAVALAATATEATTTTANAAPATTQTTDATKQTADAASGTQAATGAAPATGTQAPTGTQTSAGTQTADAAPDATSTQPPAATVSGPDAATAPQPAAPPTEAAPAGTTALAITDQGAKVLQSGTAVPAEIASNVTLDTIAYPSATEVQFGGHGKPGAFIRLYLNNTPLGQAVPVGVDGSWNATETGILPKIYTLRVDQVDATGKVTSRYETPFKRETPAALAAVMAPSAAAGETSAAGDSAGPSATTGASSAMGSAALDATTAGAASLAARSPVTVTVQPGYTLWGIARNQMGHGILYVQVWNANKDKIRNPNLIYPGQVFTLPKN